MAEADKADTQKLVFMVLHGPDHPEHATIPFVMGCAALASDVEVVLGFQAEGVELVHAGVADGIHAPGFPPLAKLLQDYYGDSVTMDDLYKYTWARIPHFFNSPYYVFQYATCFASSAQLFKAMTTGEAASRAAATERYLTLLKSGGNDHPMTQLQKAGVDLTKRETVQAVVDQLDELVTQMEAEAAKISAAGK